MNNTETKKQLTQYAEAMQAMAQQLYTLSESAGEDMREKLEEAAMRAESLQAFLEFVAL